MLCNNARNDMKIIRNHFWNVKNYYINGETNSQQKSYVMKNVGPNGSDHDQDPFKRLAAHTVMVL